MSAQLDWLAAPIPGTKTARPYQTACLAAIKQHWQGGCNRVLAVMATGTGKTWCVAHLLEALERKRMLVLVHGRRLIEQMANQVTLENPALRVQVEQADQYAEHDADVVVASIDTVGRRNSRRLDRFQSFDVVATDESHRSLSEIWLRTLRRVADMGVLLSGWTATPFRGDKRKLSDLYDRIVFELGLAEAIEQGYLCRLKAIRVQTQTSLDGVKTRKGEFGSDFDTEELVSRINVDQRNSTIISALEDYAADRKSILVHAANVEHIETLTAQLLERGHRAGGIHYKLTDRERNRTLRAFHEGELRLLVHCGICLEGYDEPRIDAALFAKPTKSRLYYYQALGRMTRLSPETGKTDALVIDVVDVCKRQRVMTAARAFGLRDVDLLGNDVLEATAAVKKAEAAGVEIADGDSLKRITARERRLLARTVKLRTQAKSVDLFGNPTVTPQEAPGTRRSIFPWLAFQDGQQHVLEIDRGLWAVVQRGRDQCWAITIGDSVERLTSTAFADPDWAKADAAVRRHAGYWKPDGYRPRSPYDRGINRSAFLRADAPRRHRAATENQKQALAKWHVPVPTEGLSYGAAHDLLCAAVWQAKQASVARQGRPAARPPQASHPSTRP